MRWFIPIILVSILLIIGLLVYRDYGVPWDEAAQILIAQSNFNYIFKGDADLLSDTDRYYGAFFELPLWWLSFLLPRPERVYIRHLLIYGIFMGGAVIFYLIGKRLLKKEVWALLGVVFLVGSPRIFSDAFYNSKDIPFMVVFIVAIWTLLRLNDTIQQKSDWWFIGIMLMMHAIACAILISTRIVGILILPLSGGLILASGFGSSLRWKRFLILLMTFLFLVAVFTFLFFPILWHDPVHEFIDAFREMSHYPFKSLVLYQGQYFEAQSLPWHYLPVWIGITTPILVLIGTILGILILFSGMAQTVIVGIKVRKLFQALLVPEMLGWITVGYWLCAPITAIYVLDSVLYDGWRQMFFIYPALVLIAIRGCASAYEWIMQYTGRAFWARLGYLSVVLVGLAEPIGFMIHFHPHQNVYFNSLAGNPVTLRQRFELDYWGLSYKQAFDYILAHVTDDPIVVCVSNLPGKYYRDTALSPEKRERLYLTIDSGDASYFIGDFRWHREDYPYPDEFYSVEVRGVKIIAVYKLR